MKKLFALLLVLALAVSLFAACGNSETKDTETKASESETTPVESESETESESEAAAGDIVIRTSYADGELYPEQVQMYELEHEGVTIEKVEVSDITKLIAMYQAGNAPDLLRIYAVQALPFYASRGIIGDYVQDYLESGNLEYIKDTSDFLPVINNYKYDPATATQGEGKIYGLVKDFSNDVAVFAWKAHLDEAGISYDAATPFTWQQLGEYAKQLTIKDGDTVTRFGLSAYDGNVIDHMRLMVWVTQLGGSAYSADFTTADWNNEYVNGFMNWALDLIKAGAITSPLYQPPEGQYLAPFLEEGFSMILCGYWYTGSIRSSEFTKDRTSDIIFLPTPQQEGAERMSFTTAACGGVALRTSENPEETVKFMDFFFAGPPATDRAKGGWGIPMFKSALELMPTDTEFDQQTKAVVMDEMEYMNNTFKVNPYIGFDTVTNLIAKYIAPVWEDQSTLDEALTSINSELQTLIEEGIEYTKNAE